MNGQAYELSPEGRNSAFDFLRLTAMLMVTLLHITGHGLAEAAIEPFHAVYWIKLFLNSFSLVAVNCFVLISGYFLSTKSTSIKKLAKLYLQVWTYSVVIYIVLALLPNTGVTFRFSTLIECMCPLLSNQYWFFTCYFLLYLIAPFLNRLANTWSQQEYRKALVILLVAFSILPSINIWGDKFGTNRGYSLIWFVILYLTAAYLRRYDIHTPVHPGAVYLTSCVALCLFQAAINAWNPAFGSVQALVGNQYGYNGPLVLCASVSLLLWAKNTTPKPHKLAAAILSRAASLSFGIYLLQDHGAARALLWNDWIRLADVIQDGKAFLLRVVLTLVILYAAGLAAEFVREGVLRAGRLLLSAKGKRRKPQL